MESIFQLGISKFVVPLILISTLLQPTHATCTVPTQCCLTMDATYDCITITGNFYTNGHVLTIAGSGGLNCIGNLNVNGGGVVLAGGGTHLVSGEVTLVTAGSFLRIKERSSTISGGGMLIGESSSALVDIWPNLALTNDIVIAGRMAISGSGTLRNWGVVTASSGGTIALSPSLNLADVDGAVWEASGTNSVLSFGKAHTGNCALHGDIALYSGGMLDMNASIVILVPGTGVATFTWEGGILTIAQSAYFAFEDFSGSCNEPASPVQGPYGQECS